MLSNEQGRGARGVKRVGKRQTFLSQCFFHGSFQKHSAKPIFKLCLVKDKNNKPTM